MSAMTTALLHRGSRFGDLRLTGYVGSGGFSDVYEAFDKSGRRLAIKVLRLTGLDTEGQQQRIEREREALSRIGSRGVAKLLHSDLQCETPWIASEFVDGPTLQEIVEEGGPLGRDEGLSLIRRLAEILDELHQEGIAHRDLSPNNIIIGPDGPVIIDFGSARIDLEGGATGSLLLAGTSGFVPPEALRGEPVGRAGDLYSLGKIALFSTGLAEEAIPVELNSCLSEQSATRPTAQTVAAALDEFQSRVARSAKRKVTRLKRRFRPVTVLIFGALALSVGIGAGLLLQEGQDPTLSFTASQRKNFLEGEPSLETVVVGSPYLYEVQLPQGLDIDRISPAGLADRIDRSPFNHLMTLEYFELRSSLPSVLSISVEVLDPILMPEKELDWANLKGTSEELSPFFAQYEKDRSTLLSNPIVTCSLAIPDRAEVIRDQKLIVIYSERNCGEYSIHLGLAISMNDLTIVRVAGEVSGEYTTNVPGLFGASYRTRTFSGPPTMMIQDTSEDQLGELGYGEAFSTYLRKEGDSYTTIRAFLLLSPRDAFVVKMAVPSQGTGTSFGIRNWAIPLGVAINDLYRGSGLATSMGATSTEFGSNAIVIPNRTDFPMIVGIEVGWSTDRSIPKFATMLLRGGLNPETVDVNSKIGTLFSGGEYVRDFPIVLNSSSSFDLKPYESLGTSVPLGAFSIPLSPRLPSSLISLNDETFAVHMNAFASSKVLFPLEDFPSIIILEGQVASSTSDVRPDEFFERFPYCRTDGNFSSQFGIRRIDLQVLAGCTTKDIFGKTPSAQDSLLRSLPIIRVQIWEEETNGSSQELLRVLFAPEFIDDIDYLAELITSLSNQLRALASNNEPIASSVKESSP